MDACRLAQPSRQKSPTRPTDPRIACDSSTRPRPPAGREAVAVPAPRERPQRLQRHQRPLRHALPDRRSRIVAQVSAMSSHQWRAGTSTWKTASPSTTPVVHAHRHALRGHGRVVQAERRDDPEAVPRAVAPPGPPAGLDPRARLVGRERVRHPHPPGVVERDDVLGGQRAQVARVLARRAGGGERLEDRPPQLQVFGVHSRSSRARSGRSDRAAWLRRRRSRGSCRSSAGRAGRRRG